MLKPLINWIAYNLLGFDDGPKWCVVKATVKQECHNFRGDRWCGDVVVKKLECVPFNSSGLENMSLEELMQVEVTEKAGSANETPAKPVCQQPDDIFIRCKVVEGKCECWDYRPKIWRNK